MRSNSRSQVLIESEPLESLLNFFCSVAPLALFVDPVLLPLDEGRVDSFTPDIGPPPLELVLIFLALPVMGELKATDRPVGGGLPMLVGSRPPCGRLIFFCRLVLDPPDQVSLRGLT